MVSGLCPEAENVAECEEAILILFKSVFRENGSKGLKLDGLPFALPDLCLEFLFLRHFLIRFRAFFGYLYISDTFRFILRVLFLSKF